VFIEFPSINRLSELLTFEVLQGLIEFADGGSESTSGFVSMRPICAARYPESWITIDVALQLGSSIFSPSPKIKISPWSDPFERQANRRPPTVMCGQVSWVLKSHNCSIPGRSVFNVCGDHNCEKGVILGADFEATFRQLDDLRFRRSSSLGKFL